MLVIIGLLVTMSMFAIHGAYVQQITDSWKRNQTHDISTLVLVLNYFNLWLWSAWGLMFSPVDWFMFGSMAPGIVTIPLLFLQRRSPRPNLLMFALLAISGCLLLLPLLAFRNENESHPVFQIVAWTAATFSIALTITGAPRQYFLNRAIMRLRKVPEVSMSLLATVTVGYVLWSIYGIATGNNLLIATNTVGAMLWSILWFQVFSARRAYVGGRS